jgi:hypothetical protein
MEQKVRIRRATPFGLIRFSRSETVTVPNRFIRRLMTSTIDVFEPFQEYVTYKRHFLFKNRHLSQVPERPI